jgi:hypothetical protein
LARTSSTASNVRESYLRFDLSGIGAIGSARLRVYGRLNDTANPSVVVGVYGSSNTSWTEGTITWNTRPARSSTALAQQTVTGTTSRWYEWDVTAHLKALKTAGATAVTLVLANPTATTSRADFQSDEAAGNRPELVIDADQVQPPPPQNVQVRPGHDALVRSGSYGSTNYGSTTGLYAGRSALSSNTRESYLKFDITQFSSSADLITLRLFGRVYEGPDPSVSVGVYSTADTSWSESTITWNSRPPRSTTALATVAVSGTTDKWYVWDVTQYVLARKAAGDSVVTFVLAGTVTSETRARFNSDEVGSNGPLLVES